MQTAVLIPAFEPRWELIDLISRLSHTGDSIVVVDDGSGSGYSDTFGLAKAYAHIISYSNNRGKGHALKTGLEYIMEHFPQPCTVVTVDSDGQHTAPDVQRVAEAAAKKPEAFTLGVRTFGSETPARSKFGNAVTRSVFRLSTGVRVSDTQTGLRAFSSARIPMLLAIRGDRYEYEMNVLLECARLGIPINEVPISTVYMNNNKGSHFHTFRDSFLVYGGFLQFAASSLIGFMTDYSLYSLLVWLLGKSIAPTIAVPVSNVSARIVSAGVNFGLNKHFVFRSKASVLKTGTQYFILAACILAGNTLLLSFLVSGLGLNKYAAKLVTEATFFTVSFLGQRFWIFRKTQPMPAGDSKKRRDRDETEK